MKRLIKSLKLHNPIWQGIGAIIGVIAVFISTATAYDIYLRSAQSSNLTVSELLSFNPLQFSEAMEGRIALQIDGLAAESVVVYFYSISNTGQTPIQPDDYIKPIQVSVGDPWELLAVEVEDSNPPELQVTWTKLTTNTFEMEPALLNPNDTIQVLLFVTNPTEVEKPSQLHWTARIVNLRSLEMQSRQTAAEKSGLGIFFVGISHYGWGLYWLAGLTVSLFTLGVLLGIYYQRLARFSLLQIVLLITIMALSFSSSEIIVDLLIERKQRQWWGAWFLLALHLGLLIYLVWPSIKKQVYRATQKAA